MSKPRADLNVEPAGLPALALGRRPFHVLAKPTGPRCNLACDYCFFLSKEEFYPDSAFRMGPKTQEAYLRQLFSAHAGAPEVIVAWQGGEPTLMGLDFFRQSIQLERQLAEPGQSVLNTIQTNGTLIDDEWATFLTENHFLVGISIDGPAEVHDEFRHDKAGAPTHHRVMAGLERLRDHNVDYNVLCTVNAANQDRGPEVYRFLRDESGAEFIQFIPIVERPSPGGVPTGTEVTERSVSPEGFGRFMVEVFEEWVRRDVGTVYVQQFDSALATVVGEPGTVCVNTPVCGRQVVLEDNGDLYSCDHFVQPDCLIGNIAETTLGELVDSPQQAAFGQAKYDTLTEACRACAMLAACWGGCPKDRFATSALGEPGHQYLCAGYRAYFEHVAEPLAVMAHLLSSDRAPSDIMARYSAADATRGRNDACPCGSGRKWKNCHGSQPSGHVSS